MSSGCGEEERGGREEGEEAKEVDQVQLDCRICDSARVASGGEVLEGGGVKREWKSCGEETLQRRVTFVARSSARDGVGERRRSEKKVGVR